jgi:hypothetical protein
MVVTCRGAAPLSLLRVPMKGVGVLSQPRFELSNYQQQRVSNNAHVSPCFPPPPRLPQMSHPGGWIKQQQSQQDPTGQQQQKQQQGPQAATRACGVMPGLLLLLWLVGCLAWMGSCQSLRRLRGSWCTPCLRHSRQRCVWGGGGVEGGKDEPF